MEFQIDLPDDLIEEVFRRLRGKSLLRFKCLSKTWYTRISQFKFKPQLLVLSDDSKSFHSCIDNYYNFQQLDNVPWEDKEFAPRIGGSCNGLLLLVFKDYDNYLLSFFVWNPFTHYYNQVLKMDLDDDYNEKFGFCYDSYTDDYKVLLGLYRRLSDEDGGRVFVGSLKTKRWTEIDAPFKVDAGTVEGPLVLGNVHWSVDPDKHTEVHLFDYFDAVTGTFRNIPINNMIVYFDRVKDEFKEIPLPDVKDENEVGNIKIHGLGVLDECLCMTRRHREEDRSEVMIMKEYGVKESWTTLFIVPYYVPYKLVPLFLYRDTEEVLLYLIDRWEFKVMIYELTSGLFWEIEIFSKWRPCNYLRGVARYEQSLTFPTRLNMEQKDDDKDVIQYLSKKEDFAWEEDDFANEPQDDGDDNEDLHLGIEDFACEEVDSAYELEDVLSE